MADQKSTNRLFLVLALVAIAIGIFGILVTIVVTYWGSQIAAWVSQQAWPTVMSFFGWLQSSYSGLTDWRFQVAALAALVAVALLALLVVQSLRLRAAEARIRNIKPASDAAVGHAEAERGKAEEEATQRVAKANAQRDQLSKRIEVQQIELDRLEWLRTQMIALDEGTISEMVGALATPAMKRAEAISRILYALLRIVRHSIGDARARDSFIECLVDGQPRAIPFPPSSDPAVLARYNYKLRVLKDFELTAAEKYEIEHIPQDQGLVNRAIATGKRAYVPDVNADDAVELGYWRPNHEVSYRSMICVPAFAMERVVGVICADSGKVDGFSPWERELVQNFATKIAVLYAALPSPALWD
jgi:hypothetical protein